MEWNIKKKASQIPENSQKTIFSPVQNASSDFVEQHCPVDYTKNDEGRGSIYNSVWMENDVASQNQFPGNDTFAYDFEDELISSTPFRSTRPFASTSFLTSSTPAPHKMNPNCFSTPKPLIDSTPSHTSSIGSTSFNGQQPKKSQMWDDF